MKTVILVIAATLTIVSCRKKEWKKEVPTTQVNWYATNYLNGDWSSIDKSFDSMNWTCYTGKSFSISDQYIRTEHDSIDSYYPIFFYQENPWFVMNAGGYDPNNRKQKDSFYGQGILQMNDQTDDYVICMTVNFEEPIYYRFNK